MTNEEGRVAFMELLRAYNAEEDDRLGACSESRVTFGQSGWQSQSPGNRDAIVRGSERSSRNLRSRRMKVSLQRG